MPEGSLTVSEAGDDMILTGYKTESQMQEELDQVSVGSEYSKTFAAIAGLAGIYLVSAQEYAQATVPILYFQGFNDSESALLSFDVGEPADRAKHQTVVQRMSQQLEIDFAKEMRAVRDGVEYALTEAELTSIRATFSTSSSRAEAAKAIRDIINAQAIRGKNQWKLGPYTEMLVRTNERRAYNAGSINRAAEAGISVFRVSESGSTHAECARWEGQYISINGEFGLPTLTTLYASGIFHPNCMHRIFAAPLKQRELEGR